MTQVPAKSTPPDEGDLIDLPVFVDMFRAFAPGSFTREHRRRMLALESADKPGDHVAKEKAGADLTSFEFDVALMVKRGIDWLALYDPRSTQDWIPSLISQVMERKFEAWRNDVGMLLSGRLELIRRIEAIEQRLAQVDEDLDEVAEETARLRRAISCQVA